MLAPFSMAAFACDPWHLPCSTLICIRTFEHGSVLIIAGCMTRTAVISYNQSCIIGNEFLFHGIVLDSISGYHIRAFVDPSHLPFASPCGLQVIFIDAIWHWITCCYCIAGTYYCLGMQTVFPLFIFLNMTAFTFFRPLIGTGCTGCQN